MNEADRIKKKYKSTTYYILSGLIPYTEANLKLSFKPSAFFSDLEKLEKVNASQKSIKSAYYRAIKHGLIKQDGTGNPTLTKKGLKKVREYKPSKLKGSSLMVIFDIPENERYKRDRLRILLRELSF
jgi:hypothetical protein